ncbi:MAG: DUF2914 domain-containing protein [Polyangiaceae bacterium]|nr:DUF2914 domain-containing protein [Polyangiaceae bacterium]
MRAREWPTFFVTWLLVAGCDEKANAPASASAPMPQPAPVLASGSASEYDEETSTRPVELLKFSFASGIRGRDPASVLEYAKPNQRVYAHLTLRNRSGRKRTVHVVFKVNGAKRTEVDLDVDASWSWRTWAYNTVLAKDTSGTLSVEVTDDEGNAVAEGTLPIRPK